MHREIPLTQGQVAIVDVEDYERIAQWRWCAQWRPSIRGFYAMRRSRLGEFPTQRTIVMHREVLGVNLLPVMVDHVEPSHTLDNRRRNLRIATAVENARNRRRRITNLSGFKGVRRDGLRWRAAIFLHGKHKHLGMFDTAEAGHEAYCRATAESFGEFARGE